MCSALPEKAVIRQSGPVLQGIAPIILNLKYRFVNNNESFKLL